MITAVLACTAAGLLFGFLLGLCAGMRGRYRPGRVHQGPLRGRDRLVLEQITADVVRNHPL